MLIFTPFVRALLKSLVITFFIFFNQFLKTYIFTDKTINPIKQKRRKQPTCSSDAIIERMNAHIVQIDVLTGLKADDPAAKQQYSC